MKNHQSHPTGSKSFPKVNEIFVQETRKIQRYRYGKYKWKIRGDNPSTGNRSYHQKWRHNKPKQEKGKNLHKPKDNCHRCGIHGQNDGKCIPNL